MRKVNTLNPPSGNPPRARLLLVLEIENFQSPPRACIPFSLQFFSASVFNFFLLLEGSQRAFSSRFRGPKPSKPHLDQLKSQNELTFPKNVPGSTRPTGKKTTQRTAPAALQNLGASRKASLPAAQNENRLYGFESGFFQLFQSCQALKTTFGPVKKPKRATNVTNCGLEGQTLKSCWYSNSQLCGAHVVQRARSLAALWTKVCQSKHVTPLGIAKNWGGNLWACPKP